MARFKFVSLIALIVGPYLLVTNYQETSEKQRIDREGIETAAIPMSKSESRGRKGSRTYKIEIQYPVQGAKVQTAQVTVSHELYDRIDNIPVIKVKYLKEDTSKLIVVGERIEKPEMYGAGALATALGVFGVWWNFIRKKRDANTGAPAAA